MAASAQQTEVGLFETALRNQQAGRLAEAGNLYREILRRNPEDAVSWHNLGLILATHKNEGAALALFWNAIRINPDFAEAHNSLGNAYKALNFPEDAERHFRRAISAAPPTALYHFNLGNLMQQLGRYKEAENCHKEALAINPRYKEACVNCGNALRQLGRRDAAFAMFQKSLSIDPDYALGHIGVANILRDWERSEEALPHYRQAVEKAPDLAIAHFNFANVLRDLGHAKGAEAGFRRAIDLDPSNADYYRHLIQVATLKPDDILVIAMQEGFESPTNTEWARMNFGFALGAVFDKARLHDEAFRYFAEANRLKRKTITYNVKEETIRLEGSRRVFAPEKFASLPQSGIDDETPIFVIGMMRSGTTLTEQILASHPDVAGAGELLAVQEIVTARSKKSGKDFPESFEGVTAEELAEMGRTYLARLRAAHGSEPRRIVDKMPQNFLYAGLIRLMLPKARFVYLTRDAMDNCFSIFSILFTEGHPYAYDLSEIGAYYRFSEKLMAHWQALFADRIHVQQYESLAENSEAEVRKLLDFCGLSFHENCLNFHKTERLVRTASAMQVREGFNRRSVERWKPYERHLRELKKALREG
jgi:tetratricopeptide (TPR) repeat protein